jgi:hypothetical protein
MRDASAIWDAWLTGGPFIGDKAPCSRVTVQLPWGDRFDFGSDHMKNGVLYDPTTGRPAWTGPLGEGGYGADPGGGAVSWTMPDGRVAWYYPGQFIQAGNQAALGLPVTSNLYARGATKFPGYYDFLIATLDFTGNHGPRGLPLRYYQKADNSQEEKELPNIKSVSIDRSIDTDAATCNIEVYNVQMYDNDSIPANALETGNLGFFTHDRGVSGEASSRWNHVPNEWFNLLVPNTVIRTYQGYGGHDKTIEQAVDDGNLLLTGVWLVDDVRVTTSGFLSVRCRDMAKLLIEQQLYPPLVPSSVYPLEYSKWKYRTEAVRSTAKKFAVTFEAGSILTEQTKPAILFDSSTQREFGPDAAVRGHKPSHIMDNDPNTFWLSRGHLSGTALSATEWIEFSVGAKIDQIHINPLRGGYSMYVSIRENGKWVGTKKVPYAPDGFDNGAAIPYMMVTGIANESARDYSLPRIFNAERVRLTFRNLIQIPIAETNFFRVGIREASFKEGPIGESVTIDRWWDPWTIAGASMKNDGERPGDANFYGDPVLLEERIASIRANRGMPPNSVDDQVWVARIMDGTHTIGDARVALSAESGVWLYDILETSGYWVSNAFGHVDAFGDSRRYPGPESHPEMLSPTSMCSSKTGMGYYTLYADGLLRAYGDAVHRGNPQQQPQYGVGPFAWDMALTTSGFGYWILRTNGQVFAYGDAADLGGVSVTAGSGNYASSIAACATGGFWVLKNDGTVTAKGGAPHYGNYSLTSLQPAEDQHDEEVAQCVRGTPSGEGYWVLTSKGRIQAFGDAEFFGAPAVVNHNNPWTEGYWKILTTLDGEGYGILRGNGSILPFGSFKFWGSSIPGTSTTLRSEGNYRDYSVIVRDLALWSGFFLYDVSLPGTARPSVYGNIESTGIASEEPLPVEMFDKRPVIDAMNELKEVVGYILYVDEEGGFRFESPNFWSIGNFDFFGNRTSFIPEIDERVQLLDYSYSYDDASLRSAIIIASDDPDESGSTTLSTTYIPDSADDLRGLIKPAMWINEFFLSKEEQVIMAELIALHIAFQKRIGQVTIPANPNISINDQVRIFERQTGEAYIHYVRGVQTNHDLDTGAFTSTLTTHWLGESDFNGMFIGGMSDRLVNYLRKIAPSQFDERF